MKKGMILDANDVKKLIAKYFGVDEANVIKNQYSYTVIGVTEEPVAHASESVKNV